MKYNVGDTIIHTIHGTDHSHDVSYTIEKVVDNLEILLVKRTDGTKSLTKSGHYVVIIKDIEDEYSPYKIINKEYLPKDLFTI